MGDIMAPTWCPRRVDVFDDAGRPHFERCQAGFDHDGPCVPFDRWENAHRDDATCHRAGCPALRRDGGRPPITDIAGTILRLVELADPDHLGSDRQVVAWAAAVRPDIAGPTLSILADSAPRQVPPPVSGRRHFPRSHL